MCVLRIVYANQMRVGLVYHTRDVSVSTKKDKTPMRYWILIGMLLAACSSSTVAPPTRATPTMTQPTVVTTPAGLQPTSAPIINTPNIYYQYQPEPQLLERISNAVITPIAQTIPVQQVMANSTHTVVAIGTQDATTVIVDVATGQQSGPFDACDSMIWATDDTTLWCMRFGSVYAIDPATQTDQLSITPTDDIYWAELTRHPVTQDYWMLIAEGTQNKLCQFDTTTQTLGTECLDAGQMPRWSPDGELIASIVDQQLLITDINATPIARVGLGDTVVTQLTWTDATQLAINTPSRHYRYQINDARISLQASDVLIVGR